MKENFLHGFNVSIKSNFPKKNLIIHASPYFEMKKMTRTILRPQLRKRRRTKILTSCRFYTHPSFVKKNIRNKKKQKALDIQNFFVGQP